MNKEAINNLLEFNKNLNKTEMYEKCKLSVSKIVDAFKTPFDRDGQAERCSKKYKDDPNSKYYNMEPWDIIELWESNAARSRHIGTSLDSFIGAILEHKIEKVDNIYNNESDESILARYDVFKRLVENELNKNGFKFICREQWVCDYEYGWKGRFDVLFEKDDSVLLIDWKSNETISTENKYDNLKGPLYKYCASDLNGYTIQLYLYKYALEKYFGFKNVKVLLCQINDKGYNFYKPAIEYSETLVEQILKYATEKLNQE